MEQNAKKTIKVSATFIYELEIDADSSIVQEYDNDGQLIEELVSYRFSLLPVIGNGVEIKDIQVETYEVVF